MEFDYSQLQFDEKKCEKSKVEKIRNVMVLSSLSYLTKKIEKILTSSSSSEIESSFSPSDPISSSELYSDGTPSLGVAYSRASKNSEIQEELEHEKNI